MARLVSNEHGREWCEETSPGARQDDGRGWFRTSDLSRVKRDPEVRPVSVLATPGQ
jgi:hypothetical protein